MTLLDALQAVQVKLQEVPGWQRRRTPGAFEPSGIMVHDTVRPDCLEMIVRGRPGISGPLANLLVSKDATVFLISSTRCHHAGYGARETLDEVKAGIRPPGDAASRGLHDSTIGNNFFYGIEVDNRSDASDPYPDEQIEALISCCVAIRSLHPEWQGFREIHHRQWTARKTDMRYQGDIAGMVACRLAGAASLI